MVSMGTGDRCVIHTPGGGGWGDVSRAKKSNGTTLPLAGTHVPHAAGSLAAFEETQGGSH